MVMVHFKNRLINHDFIMMVEQSSMKMMSDEDINIFKSLGYGVEENVMTLTLVVSKVRCTIRTKRLM